MVGALGRQGDPVGEAGDFDEKAVEFPGLVAVIQGGDQLEGLGDLVEIGFQRLMAR
nr:hypothetical protein [Halomonas sp. M4R1S46]